METKRTSKPGAATDESVPSVHLKSPSEAEAYKAGIAEGLRRARGGAEPPAVPDFDPVPLRARSDGWTPGRQIGFIRALAETACVSEACRRIGKSTESAYVLARRPDAQSFRLAWDIALDNAVRRVGDGAYSRAVNGIEIPHFYKGELVGTHRRFDERLTMFILRTRDPDRFGPKAETAERAHTREGRALDLGEVLHFVKCDAEREARGFPLIIYPELGTHADDDEDYDEDGENGARTRDMTHLYAFAPRVHDEEEDLEDEAPEGASGEENGLAADDPSEAEAEAVWAAAHRYQHAVLAREEDDDEPVPPLASFIAEALAALREAPSLPQRIVKFVNFRARRRRGRPSRSLGRRPMTAAPIHSFLGRALGGGIGAAYS
ncbi:MAG TPA: hypothetical protein VF552_04240 [Allosphingosinicella sp.]|jgi:hypothetical protein